MTPWIGALPTRCSCRGKRFRNGLSPGNSPHSRGTPSHLNQLHQLASLSAAASRTAGDHGLKGSIKVHPQLTNRFSVAPREPRDPQTPDVSLLASRRRQPLLPSFVQDERNCKRSYLAVTPVDVALKRLDRYRLHSNDRIHPPHPPTQYKQNHESSLHHVRGKQGPEGA